MFYYQGKTTSMKHLFTQLLLFLVPISMQFQVENLKHSFFGEI